MKIDDGVREVLVKLTGQILGDIYLGNIKKWNDPAIAKLNPGVPLPGLPITVVHRSDGSGTSFLFTTYLSMKNAAWQSKVGGNSAPSCTLLIPRIALTVRADPVTVTISLWSCDSGVIVKSPTFVVCA